MEKGTVLGAYCSRKPCLFKMNRIDSGTSNYVHAYIEKYYSKKVFGTIKLVKPGNLNNTFPNDLPDFEHVIIKAWWINSV